MLVLGGFGIVLAGVSLVIARHGGAIGEVVAGMLLLFSGAYFPPEILPPVLRQLSLVMPITYWLEGMRRALSGGVLTVQVNGQNQPISPTLAAFSNSQLLLIVTLCGIICAAGSYFFFQWVEHQAKERGMIDRVRDTRCAEKQRGCHSLAASLFSAQRQLVVFSSSFFVLVLSADELRFENWRQA